MMKYKPRIARKDTLQLIQPKLTIGQPGDKYEQEADAVADKVMSINKSETIQMQPKEEEGIKSFQHSLRMQAVEEEEELMQPKLRMQPIEEEEEMLQPKGIKNGGEASRTIENKIHSSKGQGTSLPSQINQEIGTAMGSDFSNVKIHTSSEAVQMNKVIGARAFTHGSDIYFNKGQYKPSSQDGKHLLAHELTHVVQQNKDSNKEPTTSRPDIQRAVELRPPGRGEASAFDRAQEIVDRLNAISSALDYELDGQILRYDVVDETLLTHFDEQMRGYIDRAEVVPMRLITGAGYVGGGPLMVDSLQLGYVDLEDLLASDDLGFQSNIIHVLAERFAVRNYDRRLGTAGVGAEWARAHPIGLNAEAAFFQNIFSDPSIRFSWDRTSPNGNYIAEFLSRDNRYRVRLRINGGRSEIRGTQISVRTADARIITADAFLAERAEAEAAP